MASRTTGPLATATGTLFQTLSAVRRKRVFHPVGVGYAGELRIERGGDDGFFTDGRTYRAIARLSRAAGLPPPLPDALGLAFRLEDAHGAGRHQDFLLVTSGAGPLLHHLLLPAPGGFFSQPYSSLLPYRVGSGLCMVGALPSAPAEDPGARPGSLEEVEEAARRGPLVFRLALPSLEGRWRPAGTLTLEERVPQDEIDGLRLNPWNTGGGLRPAGPLNGLRDAAYKGSQHGRPDT